MKSTCTRWAAVPTVLALAAMLGCQSLSTSTAAKSSNSQQSTPGTLTVAPNSASFGSVQTGTTESQTETVTNTGTSSVTIMQAPVTGAAFSMGGISFPLTLKAGQSTNFSVTFSPTSPGSASGNISITSDASNATLAISLSGSGTTTPGQLAVTPATLSLGSVAVGTNGSTSGSLTATGTAVKVTGASSSNSQFTLGDLTLPVTIPAGHSVAFTVTFIPRATGTASATLTFNSSASPSLTTGTLSGTGTAAPSHTVNLSWHPSNSSNVVGYNIYRAALDTSCGSYSRLNSALNSSTSYADSSVADGFSYCYVTTAVNSSNEESPYSAVVQASIPAP